MSEYNKIKRGIASTLLATMFLTGCGKSEEKQETDPVPTDTIANITLEEENLESDTTSVNLDAMRKLVKVGYSEYSAMQIAKNFSAEAINDLLDLPYIAPVENYIYTNDFKYVYLQDYENARLTLNMTPEDVVFCVNNAHILKANYFFKDLDINQIADILRAIDNKDKEVDVADLIYGTVNQIVTNYLFGTVTEEDLKAINVLPYLARENSDIYNFNKQYSELLLKVMQDPTNEEGFNKLHQYIRIFAENIFNAQHNNPEHLTDDEEFNNNAIINTHYDWLFVKNGIIYATYEIAFPYAYEDERFREAEELNALMESALQLPELNEYVNSCTEGR